MPLDRASAAMAAAMVAVPHLPRCVVAVGTGTAEGLSDPLASRPQGMDSPAAAEVREGAILGLPSATPEAGSLCWPEAAPPLCFLAGEESSLNAILLDSRRGVRAAESKI